MSRLMLSQFLHFECNRSKCPGPLAYYKALGCKPIYSPQDSCCAVKYDCSLLNERSRTKCYVNGEEYELGERLKEEDANPCDDDCTCSAGYDGVATFNCQPENCSRDPPRDGCFRRKKSPLDCCPGEEECPEDPSERAECNVNGTIYRDGDSFEVESDPDLNCVCQPGYQGKNVEPFCAKLKRPNCSPYFRNASDIFNNCTPVYYSNENPATDCGVFSTCQNRNDTVVRHDPPPGVTPLSGPGNLCVFGDLTLRVGDELNQATDNSSVCVKCVCEVPPISTCQRLPADECDVTKHPPSSSSPVNSQNSGCDETKCKGPLAYYKALGCMPIYSPQDSCCAVAYDCSSVRERSKTKCYVNNKEYEIGESLKDEDANPCDVGCTCTAGYDGIAAFNCAVVDCFSGPVNSTEKRNCYRIRSPLNCCPGEETCPDERPECNVDGKIYLDGEYFRVESDPDLNCVCQEGYKGENIEPFCVKPKRPNCSPDFKHASDIFNNCTPVYYSNENPATDCSVFSRCQNANDTVVKRDPTPGAPPASGTDELCYFGNLTLNVGDELNQATDYSSVCVKCVCEVPPEPTCQRLSDEECDVTDHPPFSS